MEYIVRKINVYVKMHYPEIINWVGIKGNLHKHNLYITSGTTPECGMRDITKNEKVSLFKFSDIHEYREKYKKYLNSFFNKHFNYIDQDSIKYCKLIEMFVYALEVQAITYLNRREEVIITNTQFYYTRLRSSNRMVKLIKSDTQNKHNSLVCGIYFNKTCERWTVGFSKKDATGKVINNNNINLIMDIYQKRYILNSRQINYILTKLLFYRNLNECLQNGY